jgi:hypothetical protein
MEDNQKLKVLHETLVKDNYELPDYNTFASDLRDPAKSKPFYDALIADKYEMPDYETFVSDLGLKKKDVSEYGLPTSKILGDIFSKVAGDIPKIEAGSKDVSQEETAPSVTSTPIQYPHWTDVSKVMGIPLGKEVEEISEATGINPSKLGVPETVGGEKPQVKEIPSLQEIKDKEQPKGEQPSDKTIAKIDTREPYVFTVDDYLIKRGVNPETVGLDPKVNTDRLIDVGEKEDFDKKLEAKGLYQPDPKYKESYAMGAVSGLYKGTATMIRDIGYMLNEVPKGIATELGGKIGAGLMGLDSETAKKYRDQLASAIDSGMYGNTSSVLKEGYEGAAKWLESAVKTRTPDTAWGRALENTGAFIPDLIGIGMIPASKAPLLVKWGMQGMLKFPAYLGVKTYVEGAKEGKPLKDIVLTSAESTAQGMVFNGLGVWAHEVGAISKSVGAGMWTSKGTEILANSLGFGGITSAQGGDAKQGILEGFAFSALGAPEMIKQGMQKKAMLNWMTATDNNIRMVAAMKIDPFKLRKESNDLWEKAQVLPEGEQRDYLLWQKNMVDNTIDIAFMSNQILKNPQAFIKSINENPMLSPREKKVWTNKVNNTVNMVDPRIIESQPITENIKSLENELGYWTDKTDIAPEIKASKIEALTNQIKEQKEARTDIFGKPLDDYAPKPEKKPEKAPEEETVVVDEKPVKPTKPKKEEPTGVKQNIQKELDKDGLVDAVKNYNGLTPAKKKKNAELLNSIKVAAQKLGITATPTARGIRLTTSDGKKVTATATKPDQAKIESQKLLEEHTPEFQQYVNDVLTLSPDLRGVLIKGLTPDQRIQAYNDIKSGKKTQASLIALSELKLMHETHGGIEMWHIDSQTKQVMSPMEIRTEIDAMNRKELESYAPEDYELAYNNKLINKDEYERLKDYITDEQSRDAEERRIAEEDIPTDITGNDQNIRQEGKGGEEVKPITDEKPNEPNPPISKGEENQLPGGTETGKEPVITEGEAKPVRTTDPVKQKQIEAIDKEYDTKIVDKQKELDGIPDQIDRAVKKANERKGLFGDTTPIGKDEIISRDEQGFKVSLDAVKKPFEERKAQLTNEIDALNKERESKIGEVLKQQSLDFGEPVKIETDPSRIQEIKNSIAEGEMILKSGKNVSGEKMTPEELSAVQRSVDSSKAKLGEVDKFSDIRPNPNDIPLQLANDAYRNTSFDPEKRAASEQKGYVDQVNSVIEEMSKLAKSPEQETVLKSEIERYKKGLAEKTKAYLAASSRTASSMITGPSNFPVERNRKAMDVADKRRTELLDWDKRAQESIKKAILDARTPEQQQSDKWKSIKKNLDSDIATIVGLDRGEIRGYNRALFVSSMKGFIDRMAKNGQVEDVRMALDYIKKAQEGLKKPIFADRNEVWNNVKVAEEALMAKEVKEQSGIVDVADFNGAKIVNNNDIERVQIFMDEKPSTEVVTALKKEGWNWSPSNKAWQRKNTPQSVYSAKGIIEKFYEPKSESKVETPIKEAPIREIPTMRDQIQITRGGYKWKDYPIHVYPDGRVDVEHFGRKTINPDEYTIIKKETSKTETKAEPTKEGIKYKDKTYTEIVDVLDDIANGTIAKEDGQLLREAVNLWDKENQPESFAKSKKAKQNKKYKNEPNTDKPEELAWDEPLPLSIAEDPNFKFSDLNNAMSIRNLGRNLIQNLGLVEGADVRTGFISRFSRKARGLFNPASGVIRVNTIRDLRALTHEIGHKLDFEVFDIRGIVSAGKRDPSLGSGVDFNGETYANVKQVEKAMKDHTISISDGNFLLDKVRKFESKKLKEKYSEIVEASKIKGANLKKLREKYGSDVVDGVLQRIQLKKEFSQLLKDVGYPSKDRKEGIAEFVYNYVIDPKQLINSTPNALAWFEKLLDNAPAIKDALHTFRKQFAEYDAQDVRVKGMAEVQLPPETKTPWLDGIVQLKDKTLYSLVNQLQYLEQRVKEWEKIPRENSESYKNPWISAKELIGIDGKAQQFLLYSPFSKKGNEIILRKDVKPLIPVIRHLVGTPDYLAHQTYLVALDAIESHNRQLPRQAYFDKETAVALKAAFEKQYGAAKLMEFQADIQKYNESLLDFAVDAGRISKETADYWKKQHQNYVPLKRIAEVYEKLGGKKAVTRDMLPESEKVIFSRKGSTKQIKDIFESMIENTYKIIGSSERNLHNANVRDMFLDFHKENQRIGKGGAVIEEISARDVIAYQHPVTGEISYSLSKERPSKFKSPKGRILTVFEQGKPRFYDIAPEYYDNIFQTSVQAGDIMAKIIRIASAPSRWLQAGAVVYDPTFPIRNVIRDQISSWFYSKHHYMPTDFVKGLMSALKKDDYYQKWMASGGDQSFLVSADQMISKEYAAQKVGPLAQRKFKSYAKNPLLALQDFSKLSEIGTRLGAFKNAYKKTKNVHLAAIESRDISADYGIKGAVSQHFVMFYPFLNARTQHLRMTLGAMKNPSFLLKGMAITIPAILNWLNNNRDEESKQLYQSLSTFRRLAIFNIRIPGTDHFFPMPKGFFGTMFGTSVESVLDAMVKDDPRVLNDLPNQLFKDISPIGNVMEAVPFIMRPQVEVWANKKGYTGKPIVSESMKLLKPSEQFYNGTPEIIKKMGEALNWSPLKIQHYFNSYTGGAGAGAVNILDEVLQGMGLLDQKPEDTFTTLSRMPVFKALLTEKPVGLQSGYVSDFYDTLDKITKVNVTFNKLVQTNDFDKLDKFMQDPENEQMYSFYEGNSTAINSFRNSLIWIREQGYATMKDPLLSKQQKQDDVARMNDIVQETLLKFKDAYDNKKPFEYGRTMDEIIKGMKDAKKDSRYDLVQQSNLYNPYWMQLRKENSEVFDMLKEFGGLKEIKQNRSITIQGKKVDLEQEDVRRFNELVVKAYGTKVKSILGTNKGRWETYKKTIDMEDPEKTMLDIKLQKAWDDAYNNVKSRFRPQNKINE